MRRPEEESIAKKPREGERNPDAELESLRNQVALLQKELDQVQGRGKPAREASTAQEIRDEEELLETAMNDREKRLCSQLAQWMRSENRFLRDVREFTKQYLKELFDELGFNKTDAETFVVRIKIHKLKPSGTDGRLGLEKLDQEKRYLGNCLRLRRKAGNKTKHFLSKQEARDDVKSHLFGFNIDRETFNAMEIDHIIPEALGGRNHPDNFFLMPRNHNVHFGGCVTEEKKAYVGRTAFKKASEIACLGRVTLERH